MALFKVSKGDSTNLPSLANSADGHSWFTKDDGKFYIDYLDNPDQPESQQNPLKRQAINAERADADSVGNNIINTYMKKDDEKVFYGVCETASHIAQKVIDFSESAVPSSGFMEGTVFFIKFTRNNTVNNPTLNIRVLNSSNQIVRQTGNLIFYSNDNKTHRIQNWPAQKVFCFTLQSVLSNPYLVSANSYVTDGLKPNYVLGNAATAEGTQTIASGNYSHAEGFGVMAQGYASHAEGYEAIARGVGSHAEGGACAYGTDSHAEGINDEGGGAKGHYSHSEGDCTEAQGRASHSEGRYTFANNPCSHAEGENTYSIETQFQCIDEDKYLYLSNDTIENIIPNKTMVYYPGDEGIYTIIDVTNNGIQLDRLIDANPDFQDTVIVHYGGAFQEASHSEGYNTIADGYNSHSEGSTTRASGFAAHSEGAYTWAFGEHSHAQGHSSKAFGKRTHSEGNKGTAAAGNAHVEGVSNKAEAPNAHAEGNHTHAGNKNNAGEPYGQASHAEGESTKAYGDFSHAEGFRTKVAKGAHGAHSEGRYTYASGVGAHAEGNSAAIGDYSHAEGVGYCISYSDNNFQSYRVLTKGNHSSECQWIDSHNSLPSDYLSVGQVINCNNTFGLIESINDQDSSITVSGDLFDISLTGAYIYVLPTANNIGSHAEGCKTFAKGGYSHAEGEGTSAYSEAAHAEGYNTVANGSAAHTEGDGTKADGEAAHAEGYNCWAFGDFSHAEGGGSIDLISGRTISGSANATTYTVDVYTGNPQTNDYIAISTNGPFRKVLTVNQTTGVFTVNATLSTTAINGASFYILNAPMAIGECSHVEGYRTKAFGLDSHAEGSNTKATSNSSHAEGEATIASGSYSHAEGCNTKAEGFYSHAEGNTVTASGMASHAEGSGTTASGSYSHAEGLNTIAQRKSQHVFGEYNIADTTGATGSVKGSYIEIIGNGTNATRSNARTLDWNGNESIQGNFLPMVTNTKDLGSSSLKWANVYATNFNGQNATLTGTLSVTGQTTLNDNLSAQGITATDLIVTGNSSFINDVSFTNIPTAPTAAAGTSDTHLATTQFVSNMYANLNGALVFKGVLNSSANIPTSGYKKGWTYRIGTAGSYAGENCEIGDLLIAIEDGPDTGDTLNALHWTVAQSNIDGAVISSSITSTDNCLARFDGTTGKVIQNSLVTINDDGVLTSPDKIMVSDTNGKSISLTTVKTGGGIGSAGIYFDSANKFLIYTNSTGDYTYIPGWRNKGSTTQPIYIDSNGIAQAITGTIANDITGNAATATQVNNSLTIKVNSPTAQTEVEGTNKYTFNGSANKILDIVADDGIALTAAAGSLTIGSEAVIIKTWSEVTD